MGDVLKENPLEPLKLEPFDAVMTILCLASAAKTEKEYQKSVKNIVSLINPGGYFIQQSAIFTYYTLGSTEFDGLRLTREFAQDAVTDAGCTIISFNEYDFNELVQNSDSTCYFTLIARKNA